MTNITINKNFCKTSFAEAETRLSDTQVEIDSVRNRLDVEVRAILTSMYLEDKEERAEALSDLFDF